MTSAIAKAKERYKRAHDHLQKTVRAALPIGTRVEVELSRALVKGKIIRYGWEPADLILVNEKTGKERSFTATFHRFRILEKLLGQANNFLDHS